MPHPILSDRRVRQAIAHCLNRDELIAAVFPYVPEAQRADFRMDSFLPKTHWAYSGPYPDYAYDPDAGMALLDAACWCNARRWLLPRQRSGRAVGDQIHRYHRPVPPNLLCRSRATTGRVWHPDDPAARAWLLALWQHHGSATFDRAGGRPHEYGTASAAQWRLADGGDTIVIGFSQEPASMLGRVESAAVQAMIAQMASGVVVSQYNYDYQPVLQDGLSTIESGLASNETVAVNASDIVYSADGVPVPLELGVKVTVDGTTFAWDGSSPLQLPQLTVTYKLKPYTWSDDTPGSIEDVKLAYQINCDRALGAVTYTDCDTWTTEENDQSNITYGADLAWTIKYWPGVQTPTYAVANFAIGAPAVLYSAHQVLSDGRRLADVPAVEWATLPEIAETPLSYGPFVLTEWIRGQPALCRWHRGAADRRAVPNRHQPGGGSTAQWRCGLPGARHARCWGRSADRGRCRRVGSGAGGDSPQPQLGTFGFQPVYEVEKCTT
jgi:hypothetical protein